MIPTFGGYRSRSLAPPERSSLWILNWLFHPRDSSPGREADQISWFLSIWTLGRRSRTALFDTPWLRELSVWTKRPTRPITKIFIAWRSNQGLQPNKPCTAVSEWIFCRRRLQPKGELVCRSARGNHKIKNVSTAIQSSATDSYCVLKFAQIDVRELPKPNRLMKSNMQLYKDKIGRYLLVCPAPTTANLTRIKNKLKGNVLVLFHDYSTEI